MVIVINAIRKETEKARNKKESVIERVYEEIRLGKKVKYQTGKV